MNKVYAAYELQGYTENSDDRWLLKSGLFGEGSHPMDQVATFDSWDAAKKAAAAAANRRLNATICASEFFATSFQAD